MQKIKAIIEITRPLNLAITFFVVLTSALICGHKLEYSIIILFACFSATFVAASGNIINDYFDFEIDSINRPSRPLPANRLSKREAVTLYIIFVGLSIILAIYISYSAFALVIFTNLLLYIYSNKLKGIPLVGNVVVSVCAGLAFVFGGIAAGNIKNSLIPAIFAFLINLIREIVKDVEDVEGDVKFKQITFPAKYGIEKTKKLLFIFIILLVVTTFYPFIFRVYNIEYFILVLFFVDLPLIYFVKEIFSNRFLTKLSKLSYGLKLLMITGLVAIIAGIY